MTNNRHSADEAVRIEAYLLSEKAGHPRGMEHTFWEQAEAIVHSRLTSKITRAKPAAKGKPVPVKKAAPVKGTAPAKKPAVVAAPPKKEKAKAVQQPLELEPAIAPAKKTAVPKKTAATVVKSESATTDKPAATTKSKPAKPVKKKGT